MPMNMPHPRRKGQTAIEYMILLGVVVALVLIAFKTQLPRMRVSANIYFNRAMLGIIGSRTPAGTGSAARLSKITPGARRIVTAAA